MPTDSTASEVALKTISLSQYVLLYTYTPLMHTASAGFDNDVIHCPEGSADDSSVFTQLLLQVALLTGVPLC